MLAGVLYPGDNDRVIVVLGKSVTNSSIYSVLDGTQGTLVEKLGSRFFVVESKAENFVDGLYANGAFLVLNGRAYYGCGTPLDGSLTNDIKENPYRRTTGLN